MRNLRWGWPLLLAAVSGSAGSAEPADPARKLSLAVTTKRPADRVDVEWQDGGRAVCTVHSPSGIGGATLRAEDGRWPRELLLRLRLAGLESLTISNGPVTLSVAVSSHGDQRQLLSVKQEPDEAGRAAHRRSRLPGGTWPQAGVGRKAGRADPVLDRGEDPGGGVPPGRPLRMLVPAALLRRTRPSWPSGGSISTASDAGVTGLEVRIPSESSRIPGSGGRPGRRAQCPEFSGIRHAAQATGRTCRHRRPAVEIRGGSPRAAAGFGRRPGPLI